MLCEEMKFREKKKRKEILLRVARSGGRTARVGNCGNRGGGEAFLLYPFLHCILYVTFSLWLKANKKKKG